VEKEERRTKTHDRESKKISHPKGRKRRQHSARIVGKCTIILNNGKNNTQNVLYVEGLKH
jgi:hypothetical protein